jgi:hypothetical protein
MHKQTQTDIQTDSRMIAYTYIYVFKIRKVG